jgi:hypothetical protein
MYISTEELFGAWWHSLQSHSELLVAEITSRLQHAQPLVRKAACTAMLSLTESTEDLRAWITASVRCFDSSVQEVLAMGANSLELLGPRQAQESGEHAESTTASTGFRAKLSRSDLGRNNTVCTGRIKMEHDHSTHHRQLA